MSSKGRRTRTRPARVLVCGSRNWKDVETLYKILSALPKGSTIIEGEAPGADTLARIWGRQLGFTVEAYPAEWQRFGRRAGILRNQKMLRKGRPELVIAFHEDLQESRGTIYMMTLARRHGVPVLLVEGPDAIHHLDPL